MVFSLRRISGQALGAATASALVVGGGGAYLLLGSTELLVAVVNIALVVSALLLAAFRPGQPVSGDIATGTAALTDVPPVSKQTEPVKTFDAFQCAVCISEKVSYFRTFSDVLEEETKAIIVDTEGNAVALMDQLRIVETGLDSLLAFIGATDSNERVVQIIERTESQLSHSRELIDQFTVERLRAAEVVKGAMEKVGDVVKNLAGMVQMVRGISRQTRMLALNATIEAVRAGESGKGFAIVASEVKGLSQQSDQAAIQIGQGIEQLEQAVQASLNAIVGDRLAKEEGGFKDISDAVSELTDNLQRLISHQRDTLTKVQMENERLADPIMQMIGAIQFQDVVKRRLSALVDCFEAISGAIDDGLSEVTKAPHAGPQELNTLLRGKLDSAVDFALSELRDTRNHGGEGEGPSEGASAIELF